MRRFNGSPESSGSEVELCASCNRPLNAPVTYNLTRRSAACQIQEQYHIDCFHCSRCKKKMSEKDASCYVVQKKIFCLNCKILRTHCYRCDHMIAPDQWVHHFDEIPFHLTCFTCDACNKQLSRGDNVGMVNDRLLCSEHHHEAINGSSDNGSDSGTKQKQKRVRTSFTQEQMNILTEAFSRDHNPDGADLERIAAEAGLMKRVTQVWFQNARARKKKSERSTGGANSANSSSSGGAGGQDVARRSNNPTASGANAGSNGSSSGSVVRSAGLTSGAALMPNSAPSISPDSGAASPSFEANLGSVTPPEFHAMPMAGQPGMTAPGPFQPAYAPEFVFRGNNGQPQLMCPNQYAGYYNFMMNPPS